MEPKNEIYNYNFSLGKRPDYTFPDGWQQVGGGPGTRWIWNKIPFGPGVINIINPVDLKAGIRQEQGVYVPVGKQQRWLVRVLLRADAPSTRVYVRVHFTNPAGYPIGVVELNYLATTENAEYQDVVITATGTSAVLVEAGLKEAGTLYIEEVFFGRLYPLNRLRLDDKGRVYVKHVEAVQEIIKPVRLEKPISVDVYTESDIRSLDYRRDSIQVYGSQPSAPLKTNTLGQAQVEIASNGYTEEQEEITTFDAWNCSTPRDVSRQGMYSLAVLNNGTNLAVVRTTISPDSIHWLWDGPEKTLSPGELHVLVAKYFLRYASVGYRSAIPERPTGLIIWYQAQA